MNRINTSQLNICEIDLGDRVYIQYGEFRGNIGKLKGFRYSPHNGDILSLIITIYPPSGTKLVETIDDNITKYELLSN